MSRNAKVIETFADGTYEFFLGVAQLDELDETLGVGPGTLIMRISGGNFRSKDMRTVIRLGLVGGGTKATQALKLVERYVDPPVPLFESVPLALKILAAALYAEDEGAKKNGEAEEEETQTGSTSRSSMATVQ